MNTPGILLELARCLSPIRFALESSAHARRKQLPRRARHGQWNKRPAHHRPWRRKFVIEVPKHQTLISFCRRASISRGAVRWKPCFASFRALCRKLGAVFVSGLSKWHAELVSSQSAFERSRLGRALCRLRRSVVHRASAAQCQGSVPLLERWRERRFGGNGSRRNLSSHAETRRPHSRRRDGHLQKSRQIEMSRRGMLRVFLLCGSRTR